MADFNLIIGNGNGTVMEFNQLQIDNTIYTGEYVGNLEQDATSSEVGRRAETAHSQGLYANSADTRPLIEESIRKTITKIQGVYTYGKRYFVNQTLTQSQCLTYLTDGDIAGLLANPGTIEVNEANGAAPFFDALIGGTDI